MPFATINGVKLSYAVEGEGPPLVLIHGFSTGSFIWDPVVPSLARRFQIFRYDHRGHGDSSVPAGPYRIQDFVDDLDAILNYFGLKHINLVGHSMGGRTALLFALQHMDKLNRLLLVGASGSAPEGEQRERFERLKEIAQKQGMVAVFDSDLYAFALPDKWKSGPEREAARIRFSKMTSEGFCAAADAILATPNMRDRLGEISVPTWVCAGELDIGPIAFNELCRSRIPNCTQIVIPGCGHYPMTDASDSFLKKMEEYLEVIS